MEDKFIATSCEFRLYPDDWNEGEGDLISIWNEDISSAPSLEELLKNVRYLDCNYFKDAHPLEEIFISDPCQEGNFSRFDADLMVDVDECDRIVLPTEEKYKKFELGEVKLYNLHISMIVKKIADLSENDVKKFLDR